MPAIKPLRRKNKGFRHPFERLYRDERQDLARLTRRHRAYNSKDWNDRRNIRQYEKNFNFRRNTFVKLIREIIKRNGHASVMDVGCGEGVFLSQLKRRFKKNITTAGVSLKRPSNDKNIDVLRIQQAERPSFSKSFDLIFSVQMTSYSNHRASVLKNIFRALKPGGIAFISPCGNYEQLMQWQKHGLIKIINCLEYGAGKDYYSITFTRLR